MLTDLASKANGARDRGAIGKRDSLVITPCCPCRGGLKKAEVDINRKMLAEMAVNDVDAFKQLAEMAKTAHESAQ